MKKWTRFAMASILALILCIGFGTLLLDCMTPMEDKTYNLTMHCETEATPDDWVYDQKGWTVFTQEGETIRELTPDGYGSFYELEEFGQTFYFSRVLSEEVESPTLRLNTANAAIAVFLDGVLLYTDWPEMENRIGYMRLPSLGYDRDKPLLVTLPQNYAGKTLTIAQSTDPSGSELQNPILRVFPCAVTLYCGYAYESQLVAESFQTAVPAALAFAAGTLLLMLFAMQSLQGKPDLGVFCGGLTLFFWLAGRLALAFIPNATLGPLPIDISHLADLLSLMLLLLFLASRLTHWRRALVFLFAGVYSVAIAAELVMQVKAQLTLLMVYTLSVIGLAGLLAAFFCGLLEWKRNWFFRCFCPLTAVGAVLRTALGCWHFPDSVSEIPTTLLYLLAGIMLAAAAVTALAEAARREMARRTEARLLAQQNRLVQSSYDVMRRQNEEVMMLRHDMMKHFRLLRQTTEDEKTAAYLEELLGQNEKIRPVVQSGNETLNIILNSKLNAAADAGIAIEIVHMQAPEKLPLSDAELCSLMMNLLDNAIEAAAMPNIERPYIKLDFRTREHFFVFSCKNSATQEHIQKETAQGRGMGLKIIRQIAARYDNLLETEHDTDYYSVKLAIPLD